MNTKHKTSGYISPQAFISRSGLIVSENNSGQTTIDLLGAEMAERIEAIIQAEGKNNIIPRFNQPKTIACLQAEFRVHENIPDALKQGLFAWPGNYPAMLRFANATNSDDSKKDIRGLSIRVAKVEGRILWGQPGCQDFLFNSYPALFVATPEEFLEFIRARQENKKVLFFLNPAHPHLKSLWIVMKASKYHLSPLDIRYWSTVPFRLGETGGQVVKYSITPCSDYTTARVVDAGENQLRAAIKAHLHQAPARFEFGVQIQTNPDTMPIEDASVIWDEKESPFQRVATITIDNQEFASPASLASCEQSSFNPWQCLAAHAPVGRMNAVRRLVYDNNRRIYFASNYDGSHESYMDDFINKVAWGLNLVFSNGVGYPTTRWLVKGGADMIKTLDKKRCGI